MYSCGHRFRCCRKCVDARGGNPSPDACGRRRPLAQRSVPADSMNLYSLAANSHAGVRVSPLRSAAKRSVPAPPACGASLTRRRRNIAAIADCPSICCCEGGLGAGGRPAAATGPWCTRTRQPHNRGCQVALCPSRRHGGIGVVTSCGVSGGRWTIRCKRRQRGLVSCLRNAVASSLSRLRFR